MQPGGGYLYGNGNEKGNGSGFRYGRGQPYCRPPPAPPEQHMTPQEKKAVLMAAGRLAAEYLVNRGDLPPNVLDNRPPAPIPLLGVGGQGQPAFGSRYHHYHQQPPVSRTFHFQGRPPAPQQHRQPWPHPFDDFQFQGQHQQRPLAQQQRRLPGPRPFQFQGGRGPFPKRRRQRPSPYTGPLGRAPPNTRYAGQAAAPAVAASKNKQDDDDGEHSAPAGETDDSQPDAPASGSRQTNEPSSSSLGAKASESS